VVDLNSEYAAKVLDKNHTGLISIKQIPNDPLLGPYLVSSSILDTNNTKGVNFFTVRGERKITPLYHIIFYSHIMIQC